MYARSASAVVPADRVHAVSRSLEEELVPCYRELQGFERFVAVVDEETGTVFGMSFWESEEDRARAEDVGQEARENAAQAGGQEDFENVARWRVLVDAQA